MGAAFVAVSLSSGAPLSPAHAAFFVLTGVELALVVGVATLFSAFTTPVLAAFFTSAVWVVGHLTRTLRDLGAGSESAAAQWLAWLAHRVLPDLESFNLASEAAHGLPVVTSDWLLPVVYGAGYLGPGAAGGRRHLRAARLALRRPLLPWLDMDSLMEPSAASIAVLVGGLGLLVGSFLNVVIYRLPRGESLLHPPSHCPGCREPVRWFDNVPLLSFCVLRGRCRHCRQPISLRYPAIEALTGLLFAMVALRFGWSPTTALGCVFVAALVATAFIDFDHQIIPDEISLGGLLLALLAVPAVAWGAGEGFPAALQRSVAGAALGGGLLWLVGFVHARLAVALGREFDHWPGEGEPLPGPASLDYWTWFPGVGFGDVKLLAMIGAVVGPFGALETIIAASLAGLVFGLLFALAGSRWNTPFGFAPAIALGALAVFLLPERFALFPILG